MNALLEKPMHVIALNASNVKRLRAVELKLDGKGALIEIAGDNSAGKSSLLDSIFMALAGAGAAPGQPIHKGEDKATIRLDLGELVVERRFTEKSTYLRVTSPDGSAEYKSPQAMLDSLVAALAFDPLQFARMAPKDQVERLKTVLGLDFTALDQERGKVFQERRDLNRDTDAVRGQLAGIPEERDLPDKPIDARAVLAELEAAQQAERNVQDAADEADRCKNRLRQLRDREKELQAQLANIEVEIKGVTGDLAQCKKHQDGLPTPPALEPIRTKLAQASAINERINAQQHRRDLAAVVESHTKQAAAMTARLTAIDAEKRGMIGSTKLPVEGLEFGDGEILLGGVPFEQAGSGEKIRVGVALAVAANPKLRVMLIRDAAYLDKAGMKLLGDLASQYDFQVWAERIEPSGPAAIVIEDGMVKGAAAKRGGERWQ